MEDRNVICLVVDRLQAPQVGVYGNTWIRTPELDRLAAESFLFDRALADTLELDRLYRGLWQGFPALWPNESAAVNASLPALFAAAGWETLLVTDDASVAALPAAAAFGARTLLADAERTELASEIEDTHAAQWVSAVSEALAKLRPPFFCWVHARGLGALWDAPYELRQQYADEEDPAVPRFVAPPCRRLPPDVDPDAVLGIAQAYAGQVSLWDTCLGALVEELRSGPLAKSTLLVFLSPRGYALGEHGRVGPVDHSLYNEQVQIPWWLRFPDALGALGRGQGLVVPADLPATLAEWLGWPPERLPANARSLMPLVRWESSAVRQCVVLRSGDDDWAVRTPGWHLRASGPVENRRLELYAKPSDRYEVNDVADRAPDIVAGLAAVLDEARAQPTAEPTGLEPALVAELD